MSDHARQTPNRSPSVAAPARDQDLVIERRAKQMLAGAALEAEAEVHHWRAIALKYGQHLPECAAGKNLSAVQEWRDADDAPRNGQKFLARLRNGVEVIVSWWPYQGWHTDAGEEIAYPAKWYFVPAPCTCGWDTATALPDHGWQPIASAPKNGTDMLVLHPDGSICISYWGSIRGQHGLKSKLHYSASGGEGDFCRDSVGWQPLPTPPTQGGTEG